MGTGFSLFLPTASDAIIATLPAAKAGSGSAINQTSRQLGQAVGVAISGSLAASGFRATIDGNPLAAQVPAGVLAQARQSIAGSYRIAEGLERLQVPVGERARILQDTVNAAAEAFFYLAEEKFTEVQVLKPEQVKVVEKQ